MKRSGKQQERISTFKALGYIFMAVFVILGFYLPWIAVAALYGGY